MLAGYVPCTASSFRNGTSGKAGDRGKNVVSVNFGIMLDLSRNAVLENRYHPADDLLCSLSGI